MSDEIKNKNGHGGARPGGGRKPKIEEDKLKKMGRDAIIAVYKTEEAFWEHIATESVMSLPHLKLLCDYLYGKPKETKSITLDTPVPVIDMSTWK